MVRFAAGMRLATIEEKTMPRKRLPQASQASGLKISSSRLNDDQLGHLAEMIADGRCEVPNDLQATDEERLQVEVRRRLRARLVRLIAHTIAKQLHREAEHRLETADHA